ncbi:WD-40 repeat-containing protein [Nocardia nova SH22a]|uniref:WD-40 repeat-containing protein n=1 Tax=Nocardia nova SH22a TaxID=1415166 RepID=W5TJ76_9NOCA|nr:hypothetical protein [Nocardia nova]AHH19013.1 WD-40 repeat-containing protein [Nocardia nova SH22a]
MTADSASTRELIGNCDWAGLWGLVQYVSVDRAAEALRVLGAQDWRPSGTQQREAFTRLVAAARDCGASSSGFGDPVTLDGEFGFLRGLATHPQQELLFAGNFADTLRMWDLCTGEPVADLAGYRYGGALSVTPDGSTLIGHVRAGTCLWPLAGSRRPKFVGMDAYYGESVRDEVEGWPAAVCSTADGTLISANRQGRIQVARLDPDRSDLSPVELLLTKRLVWIEQIYGRPSLAVTPDATMFAAGSVRESTPSPVPRRVGLFALPSGQKLATLRTGWRGVRALHVSPDGDHLVGVGADARTRIWRLPSGERVSSMRYVARRETSVVLSPDGRLIAGVGRFGRVEVRKLPDGELLGWARGNRALEVFAMSDDGRLLAGSGPRMDRILLWHLPSAEPAGSLSCGRPGPQYLGFSPAGVLVAGTTGNHARPIPPSRQWRPVHSRVLMWPPLRDGEKRWERLREALNSLSGGAH